MQASKAALKRQNEAAIVDGCFHPLLLDDQASTSTFSAFCCIVFHSRSLEGGVSSVILLPR